MNPFEEGVVIEDEHTITVNHPGFIGNPELQAYNPVISPSELDGGFSEGIYFSDPVKQKIIIKANTSTKKYGAVMPEYSSSILLVTTGGDYPGTPGGIAQRECFAGRGRSFVGPALCRTGQ